ncbi:MAG: hypothetical protein ACKOSS_09580 [Planctomycetia bacterium]
MDPSQHEQLRTIAAAQRALLSAYGLALLGLLVLRVAGPADAETAAWLLRLGLVASLVVLALLAGALARSLGMQALAVACALLTLLPLVGFVVLVVLNGRATRRLRQAGVRVGLLGARRRDLA